MDSKSRLLKAWSFQEPDRVPLEIYLYGPARGLHKRKQKDVKGEVAGRHVHRHPCAYP